MNGKIITWILSFIIFIQCPFPGFSSQDIQEDAVGNRQESNEGNRSWGIQLLADGMTFRQYDGSFSGAVTPAVIVSHSDIFGSGNSISLLFAGVYAGLDFTIIRKPGLPFNITLHGDMTTEWASEVSFYKGGEESDWSMKQPGSNLGLTLSRYFDRGFSVMTNQSISLKDYSSDSSDFTPPSNRATYIGNLDLSFSTQSGAPLSNFSLPLGFQINAVPEFLYQFDFDEWGPEGNLYSHNDKPAYRGLYRISYYFSSSDRLQWGGRLSGIHGANLYQLEKWAVGQTNAFNDGPRLSGYYPGEFLTERSGLLNLDLMFMIVPDKLAVSASHDVFYYGEKSRFYQGTALGIAVRPIQRMEISLRCGFGSNAEREDDPIGYIQELFFKYSF